jgi:hypothetical protein
MVGVRIEELLVWEPLAVGSENDRRALIDAA